MKTKINGAELELREGDITEMDTAAIVNAANANLILGAGVAGAIRVKGGPTIQAECDRIGGTFVGGAVLTGAGLLKADYVIHAVGPRMGEGHEDEKLRDAVINSLKLADAKGIKSLAFPALSTGIFGFPMDRAAEIMLAAIKKYLSEKTSLERMVICLFGQASFNVFADEFKRLFPDSS